MFKLNELLNYDSIVIQTHDNPDADAIASGFGIYSYLKEKNKNPLFIYGGFSKISKPNLLEMVSSLNIPITYKNKLDFIPDILITVDSQYGQGNIQNFKSKNVAIIDHHIGDGSKANFSDIRHYLSSCSTLVWLLLKDENYDFKSNINLSTALYYGLYTDSNGLSEIRHPFDNDFIDNIYFDNPLIVKLKNSNLTLHDLETAGIALLRCSHIHGYSFGILKANPCDPNILGFISDLAIQVNCIDVCIVYSENQSGIKFSLRSSTKNVKANELAEFISKDLGSGGGHKDKAGGFISLSQFNKYNSTSNIDAYLLNNAKEYYESFDIIDSLTFKADLTKFEIYKKNILTIGYIPSDEIYGENIPLIIRAIQGDLEIISSKDIYIMIGIEGEVWPIKKEVFLRSYISLDTPYSINIEYNPHIINKFTGESTCICSIAKECRATSSAPIYAAPLLRNTKVFTMWDRENYMSGAPSDMLAVRHDNLNDVYIIKKAIFDITYHKLEKRKKKIL